MKRIYCVTLITFALIPLTLNARPKKATTNNTKENIQITFLRASTLQKEFPKNLETWVLLGKNWNPQKTGMIQVLWRLQKI